MNPPINPDDDVVAYRLRVVEGDLKELRSELRAAKEGIYNKLDGLTFVRLDLYENDKKFFNATLDSTRSIAMTSMGFVITLFLAFIGYVITIALK